MGLVGNAGCEEELSCSAEVLSFFIDTKQTLKQKKKKTPNISRNNYEAGKWISLNILKLFSATLLKMLTNGWRTVGHF